MPVSCPFCKSMVDPLVGPDGGKVCPVCGNKGRVGAQAGTLGKSTVGASYVGASNVGAQSHAGQGAVQRDAQGNPVFTHPSQNAEGAVAALVLGIVSYVISIFGIVTAIIAIVMGGKAKRLVAQSGGRLGGGSMATAGLILGWVYIGLASLVIVAAIIFVLMQNAGKGRAA